MIRKIALILVAVMLALTSCELANNEKGEIYLISVGLGYQYSPANRLNGTIADHKAYVSQFTAMAEAAGVTLHTYSITDEGHTATTKTVKPDILSSFADVAAKAKSNDILIFTYSGHGDSQQFTQNRGALVVSLPITADTYITTDELKAQLETIHCRKVVLLDSCYSGAHIDNSGNTFEARLGELFSKSSNTDTWILAASAAEEEAYEPRTPSAGTINIHGYFTQALLSYFGYDFASEMPAVSKGKYTLYQGAMAAKENLATPSGFQQTVTVIAADSDLVLFEI